MSWKDWSYVKKGKIIGGLVGFFLLILSTLIVIVYSGYFLTVQMIFFPTLLLSVLAIGSNFSLAESIFFMTILSALSLPIYIGVGALMGKIVQKVKSK